jgi:hypothetical protein
MSCLLHFIVIDVQTIERPTNRLMRRYRFRQLTMRVSKVLREKLNPKP